MTPFSPDIEYAERGQGQPLLFLREALGPVLVGSSLSADLAKAIGSSPPVCWDMVQPQNVGRQAIRQWRTCSTPCLSGLRSRPIS